jgi:prevent-host-death family protein
MVMKSVKIAALKARLSEYLREVRRGESFTVMDRQTPIARLGPYSTEREPLRMRKASGRFRAPCKVPLPAPVRLDVDPVELLIEERRTDR